MVLGDSELAPLSRFVWRLLLPVHVVQKVVDLPVGSSLVETFDFVAHTGILRLEFEHLVRVEIGWLEPNCAFTGLDSLLDLLQVVNVW